jgi:hypothetical protein
MRAAQTHSRLERRAGSCLVLSGSSSRQATPVRQPAVRSPEGVSERVESAASLQELVELGVHPIEGVVLVVGVALELLAPTNQNP